MASAKRGKSYKEYEYADELTECRTLGEMLMFVMFLNAVYGEDTKVTMEAGYNNISVNLFPKKVGHER